VNVTSPYKATAVSGAIYYPAVKDSTGTIVQWTPVYDCTVSYITFTIDPQNPLSTGYFNYPAIPVSGTRAYPGATSIYTSGSYNSATSITFTATSGSTFLGWSYVSKSISSIFDTGSSITPTFSTSGSTIYAIVTNVATSASFCYYTSDPIGSTSCDACAVTASVYYNSTALTGSNIAGLNWYKNSLLTTFVDNGYYKISGSASSPIYYVSSSVSTQTKTLDGYCTDTVLTC
jgi:hypothetical protein